MKNYIELTNQILEQLKKDNPDLNPERELAWKYSGGDDLPEMARAVESMGLIDFDLVVRSDETDSWLQLEYYSKIEKTVIFDYDVSDIYDDLYSFAKQLAEYQEQIDKLEDKITISE